MTRAFQTFAAPFCAHNDLSPEDLRLRMLETAKIFKPVGFVMLRCVMLDSSRLGELTILPYGGKATFKHIPNGPVSPRGIASDMSEVCASITLEELR